MRDAHQSSSNRPALIGIGVALLIYGVLVLWLGPERLSIHHASPRDEAQASGHTVDSEPPMIPHLWAVSPFVFLLGGIAVLPLMPTTAQWWESNRNRFLLAVVLATFTLGYYLFLFPAGGAAKVVEVVKHALLAEYVPFIVLLFSLYTITGGIRIQGDLVAKPITNVGFLVIGGALASFVGTTGAAMLLIRALIDTNNERKYIQHTVVFFIFVVCNCGGCLLPIGDPPLFLGYLKGVDFMWTFKFLWWPWLLTNALIILVYYLWDRFICYPKESTSDRRLDEKTAKPISISGLWPNLLLLFGVILSIAFLDPNKTLPGTEWHPWPFLREAVQILLVALSLALGSRQIRRENKFNYHAIIEVAALFIGIFVCMQPALEILHQRGGQLGLNTPRELFWATGGLSAVLDNAPTYVVFYETAAAESVYVGELFHELVSETSQLAEHARQQLIGISLGAVFLGAMTYIGNGPNFMVRAIAEQSGVRMPSFFGYIFKYSLLILLPIFFIVSLLVLH